MFVKLLDRWRAFKPGAVVSVPDGYGDALIRAKRAAAVDPAQRTKSPDLPAKAPKGPARRAKKG